MSRKSVTRRDAEKFLAAVKRQRAAWLTETSQPQLLQDWDWLGVGAADWSIVWEEGPFEWAINFPFGGIDEEFGGRIADVSEGLPESCFAEAITSWAVGINLA